MSNPFPAPLPLPDDERRPEDPVTREVDGEETLDPDADPTLIDSAEADRLAAESPAEEG